ncbi:predicted protein [Nematostella vectensis]|uniref:Uncharacterized protein n=1 Tax=Nematostella vectensis TaxID=45351 RepID=A7SLW5_NEMVE|nr:predicted protein [Nematostella vectensis]|eukprot:XP_001627429.1 predicted protein [Nematostella vectensis]
MGPWALANPRSVIQEVQTAAIFYSLFLNCTFKRHNTEECLDFNSILDKRDTNICNLLYTILPKQKNVKYHLRRTCLNAPTLRLILNVSRYAVLYSCM